MSRAGLIIFLAIMVGVHLGFVSTQQSSSGVGPAVDSDKGTILNEAGESPSLPRGFRSAHANTGSRTSSWVTGSILPNVGTNADQGPDTLGQLFNSNKDCQKPTFANGYDCWKCAKANKVNVRGKDDDTNDRDMATCCLIFAGLFTPTDQSEPSVIDCFLAFAKTSCDSQCCKTKTDTTCRQTWFSDCPCRSCPDVDSGCTAQAAHGSLWTH